MTSGVPLRHLLRPVGAFLMMFLAGRCSAQNDYDAGRRTMIEQHLKGRDITDPAVLEAMAAVPRHLFVPAALRLSAYADHALPIGGGQTISQPYIVALMTQLAEVDTDEVVLEVGTGSGYQAAILSKLAREVYSIEIRPELAESARQRLSELGYGNVTVKTGDGYIGWEEKGPFDAILVTAAPHEVPPPLMEQLRPGGVMVIPVGEQSTVQKLLRIRKARDGSTRTDEIIPVVFVPLVREER
ncbi:MAG TPA: protein-L-isoaspartate(D-aspartate) O-methyltransferase [Vicinamibacteria bacterium]|nr:protein-L-isoaspartate(D-aspartate) O-methyltransferase [Vicinamibacteria bacterium]